MTEMEILNNIKFFNIIVAIFNKFDFKLFLL